MRRRTVTLLMAAVVVGLTAAGVTLVGAAFGDPATSSGNAFTTDTLNPPSGLAANVAGTTVNLSWTATSDAYATGHRVFRATAAGGPYSQVAEVTPRTTVAYADAPPDGTFYYVARAYYQGWESGNSNETSANVTSSVGTGFSDCGANAAVTSSSGDNNGFQLNPANACANDSAFAEDTNGGTANSASCSSTARDRHLYYNYGLSIPAGATINGIEVRLDAWSDGTSGTPKMCVELSWDGGATWTAAQTTAGLTTSQATYTLGSATDTWGRTWTDAEFSNANLRVRVTNIATSTAREFRLDWAAIQVTYIP